MKEDDLFLWKFGQMSRSRAYSAAAKGKGTASWSSYWATLISATVENAAPTHVVLTFPSEGTSVAADITATVNGVARAVTSASWTGGVWTVVLASAVLYGDVVVMTFVPSGGTANVTNNTIEAETTTLVGRFTTPATDARKVLINTAIKKLKTDGVFAKLDVLCLIGNDAQCSLQNWIKNAANATAVNSPIFVSDRYFQGDAISMYIQTNFNPTIGTNKYVRDSACWGIYYIAAGATALYSGYGTKTLMRPDGTAWINNGPSGGMSCGALNPGFGLVVREDNANGKCYKNGSYVSTEAAASEALVNTTFTVLSYNGGSFSNSKVAGWVIGEKLTATDVANLTDAIEAYMDGIGAGLIP